MIRLLLILILLLFVFVIFGIPCLLIGFALRLFNDDAAARFTQGYVTLAMNICTFLAGVRLHATGTENIPKEGNVLYVSNHRSLFDIFSVYRFFPGLVGCVSKKEWGKIPVLHGLMVLLHCIFLDRSNIRAGLRAMQEAAEEIKGPRSIMICPEGTRGHGEKLLPFHEGSLKPAFLSGAPIVPVIFTHTDEVFENHKPWVRPADVTVWFGKPIPTKDLDRAGQKALAAELPRMMQETYDRLV